MLLELNPTQIIYLLSRDTSFKEKVNDAVQLIVNQARYVQYVLLFKILQS